jgi:hypothetical protein
MSALANAPRGEFFQLGNVTWDIESALRLYRDHYGVPNFLRFDTGDLAQPGDPPAPSMKIALGWKGPVMIELIQPNRSAPGIYVDALREDGGVSTHHLGYFVDEATLAAMHADYLARGIEVPVETKSSIGVSLIYADTRREIGLFSELVCLSDDGRKFFDTIPRN